MGYVRILKFNPWHDAKGRFARGGAKLSTLVKDIQRPGGGFTVHPMNGQIPTTGFAVSVYESRGVTIPAKDLTPTVIVQFMKANREVVEQDGNYLGAWHNPENGLVYLDISRVLPSRAAAERLGREHDQLAIFDFSGGGKVIDLQGAA